MAANRAGFGLTQGSTLLGRGHIHSDFAVKYSSPTGLELCGGVALFTFLFDHVLMLVRLRKDV